MDIYFALWLITHAFVVPGGPNKVPEMGGGEAGEEAGDLHNRNLLLHDSGGWMSEVKVSAGLVS